MESVYLCWRVLSLLLQKSFGSSLKILKTTYKACQELTGAPWPCLDTVLSHWKFRDNVCINGTQNNTVLLGFVLEAGELNPSIVIQVDDWGISDYEKLLSFHCLERVKAGCSESVWILDYFPEDVQYIIESGDPPR